MMDNDEGHYDHEEHVEYYDDEDAFATPAPAPSFSKQPSQLGMAATGPSLLFPIIPVAPVAPV